MTSLEQRFVGQHEPGGHPYRRPKDAATLIIVDRTAPTAKVLMGKRSDRHVFFPGKFVFPGGGVEPLDRRMPIARPLEPQHEARLMRHVVRPSAIKARALMMAAIRETFEETGLLLGDKRAEPPASPGGKWDGFAEAKVHPDPAALQFVARAVTPPGRSRRYDARFFAVDAAAIVHQVEGVIGPEAELVELVWMPVEDAKRLDIAAITRIALEELQTRIKADFDPGLPVPYFRMVNGKRTRTLI